MTISTISNSRIKIGIICAVLAFLMFLLGFVEFTNRIPKSQPASIGKADAIVVLTGGSSRVLDALKLLNAGKGMRLLISGVHHSTSRKALANLVPVQSTMLDCCVDLGKDAQDTIGNAAETAAWASTHKFKSLIIVTSSYHMPRSLLELQHAMPKVKLAAYPVLVNTVPVTRWWINPGTARLLFSEYVKYLATRTRLLIN